MRRPLVAANWKMYKTPQQAKAFVEAFLPVYGSDSENAPEVVLFPPAIDLPATIAAIDGSSIGVGAQNMHFADEGAFTGDISAPMITSMGAGYILIGHSERRQYGFETDEMVNKKLLTALKHKLTPVICVGEHLEQRKESATTRVASVPPKPQRRAPESVDPAGCGRLLPESRASRSRARVCAADAVPAAR